MSEKSGKFQKLTPVKDIELKIYDDALNFVFSNEDIKNIAISGPYSAGKSSVLETYKKTHLDIQFLHISLAHFEPTDQAAASTTVCSEAIIEGKILNQLIHQISPEKIPQTNFKVKQKVSIKRIAEYAAVATTFLLLALYIVGFNYWCSFVSALQQPWLKSLMDFSTNSALLLVAGAICAYIFGYSVFSIIKVQKNKNIFRKVSLQGNEIEIFEESDESYFDKYLNEVLYLFESCESDAIVFEDMDRYNINLIFEKLKEVNYLVNKKGNKITRFFYLLRDDIFVSKDRTKFFDFIIPVVPVIDGSNSYDQFISHFKQGGIFELFNEKFLQGLSLYIDDMRILKNIFNEFVIYHNRIQSTELDCNKLLAMVTYKNIFPRDFNDLHLGMGFVHTLFESKPKFMMRELQSIDDRIKQLEEEIHTNESELLDTIDELDAAYLLSNRYYSYIAGLDISNFKTQVELVRVLRENKNDIQYYHPSYGNRNINMEDEFSQLMQNPEYLKRKRIIEKKTGNRIEELKSKAQTLKNQKAIMQNNRLRDIVTKENIKEIFSVTYTNEINEEDRFEEIKASLYFDLIKYLIRNGYIDETYPDYMNYFYENSISRIDKIFLRSVTDEMPKGYSYALKNPQLVVSRLRAEDFDHEEILNFDLLFYLLQTMHINSVYLIRFLKQLIETKNFKFIGGFLEIQRETALFVKLLNHQWPSVFDYIIEESDFDYMQEMQYAIYTLYYSQEKDIKALNASSNLSNFISNCFNFLNIDSPDIQKIITGFSILEVRFAWIEYSTSNKELFAVVYKNSMYQLTFKFITLMLETMYNIEKSNDFKTKNYTLISSKQDQPLLSYVNRNIDQYVSIILDNCDGQINDEEISALAILNNDKVEISSRERYIRYLHTVIDNIIDVADKGLWNILLQQKAVKCSEDNVLNYYFKTERGMDLDLIQFINSYNADLNFDYDLINKIYGEGVASKFYNEIVTCNQLSNEKYKAILKAFGRHYNSFPHKTVNAEKIEILVRIGAIPMTAENLIFMRGNYEEQLVQFIINNISKYINNVINIENFNVEEMLSLLEENISDANKIGLLKYCTSKISVKGKNYSETVKLHILTNNLDEAEIPYLLIAYPGESRDLRKKIIQIAIENKTKIIEQNYKISFDLLTELLSSMELEEIHKKEFFIICLPSMNEAQAKKHLTILQMTDFLSLFELKRPKLEINTINKQILDIFENKNWITKYENDKDNPGYYRAYGRKMFNLKKLIG